MRVDHRRPHLRVAKELLHGPDVQTTVSASSSTFIETPGTILGPPMLKGVLGSHTVGDEQ
jgi:hypothetical protein